MTQREIIQSSNTQALLKECGLTCKQVLKNLEADKTLKDDKKNKKSSNAVRWFCKNALIFNNWGNEILK